MAIVCYNDIYCYKDTTIWPHCKIKNPFNLILSDACSKAVYIYAVCNGFMHQYSSPQEHRPHHSDPVGQKNIYDCAHTVFEHTVWHHDGQRNGHFDGEIGLPIQCKTVIILVSDRFYYDKEQALSRRDMKHADMQKRLYHKPINGNYGNWQLKYSDRTSDQ